MPDAGLEGGAVDEELGPIDDIVVEGTLAEVLAEEDMIPIAAATGPGSAAILVGENSWAAPSAAAVRRSGG